MVFVNKFADTIFLLYLCGQNQTTKIMETKSILYGCVSVLAITISICACVFTYNNSCRVRITCEVGNVSATRYVALDDEEAISLLYAQLVHAIKNSEKVYREKCAVQQSCFNPSKFQQRAIERANAKSAKGNSECKKEDVIVNTTTYTQPDLSPEMKRKLYESIRPKINWDSIIESDLVNMQH
jgi:hypothetical protein